jgi:hypothetical protein
LTDREPVWPSMHIGRITAQIAEKHRVSVDFEYQQ